MPPLGTSAAEPAVGAVQGFRWWQVTTDHLLASLCRGNMPWATGDNAARCLGRRQLGRWTESSTPHPRGVPEMRCSCGFYAMLDPFEARGLWGNLWPAYHSASGGPRPIVFGATEGYGRVLLGRYGWRAQFARPLALYVPDDKPITHWVRATAERYAIPVQRNFDAMASEWGPDLWIRQIAAGSPASPERGPLVPTDGGARA